MPSETFGNAIVGLPIGFRFNAGRRPRVRTDTGELDVMVDEAWAALIAANNPPFIFRVGSHACVLDLDDRGRPFTRELCVDELRGYLARLVDWRRAGGRGQTLLKSMPPVSVVKTMLAGSVSHLPVLSSIVSAPVIGRSGTLLTTPGYHADAQTYYAPRPGFELPFVQARPTRPEIEAARRLIVDELLGDFPFEGDADRAHAISLLLLLFARQLIDGPTPLHLIEKPAAGTGASLLLELFHEIAVGGPCPMMGEGSDDADWEKKLTAKLVELPQLIVIDNVRRRLDSTPLATALTAETYTSRLLGTSTMLRLPIQTVWAATANNPTFSNEISRRIVSCRLDAKQEFPAQRTQFRIKDIRGWVRQHRARLVHACLTLIAAWLSAGRPPGTASLGSFEAWAQTMGGILTHVGLPGFLGNCDRLIARADSEGGAWRTFVYKWFENHAFKVVGVSDLIDLARSCDPPMDLGDGSDDSQRSRLGKQLRRMTDRVFDLSGARVQVQRRDSYQNAGRWCLVQLDV